MRGAPALLALAFLLLPGCTSPSGGAGSCPDPTLKAAAYTQAMAHAEEELWEEAMTLRLEGTMEGEAGILVFAHDPAAKALRVSDPEIELRVVGNEISYADGEDEYYARNHDPGAVYGMFFDLFEDMMAEDDVDFTDDLTGEDYEAACTTSGGVDTITYSYEEDGYVDEMVVTADRPHRVLSGRTVDPSLQDNYRASVAYSKPTIIVDDTLPKLPLTAVYELQAASNERGGTYFEGTFTEDTQWAPFSQIGVRLEDDESVYFDEDLQDGVFDWLDGDYFQYDDVDGNGLLSAGDTFSGDLGPGLYFAFHDRWAGDYVAEQAV